MFPAGTVFLWRNFPFKRDPTSATKNRWFVCFGGSNPYLKPLIVYLCMTTGEMVPYEKDGCRSDHDFLRIWKRESCFPDDCILDLTFNFYADITEEQLESFAADLEESGTLSEELLRRIYKRVRACRVIPVIVRRDIFSNFNAVGITGLKRP